MRINVESTVEVLSETREVGDLYPARRMHTAIDTGTGAVQWQVSETVLAFEINGLKPHAERLYAARKARSRGLVAGKPVYMLEYCCGGHDRVYFQSCSDFLHASHAAILDTTYCIEGATYNSSNPPPPEWGGLLNVVSTSFTLSWDGEYLSGAAVLNFGYNAIDGGVLKRYYRVRGHCFPLGDGNGTELVYWEMWYTGYTIDDGPFIDAFNIVVYTSVTPLNSDLEIYGGSDSPIGCQGPFLWDGHPIAGSQTGNGLRLRVY